MFDFYQKRKFRAFVSSPVTQAALFILVLFVAYSAYVRFDIAMEMRERRIEAENEAAVLEAKKQELQEKVDYISSERGKEGELRRQFDVALPGEEVVVIIDEEKDEPEIKPLATGTNTVKDNNPWYKFWR